MPRLAAFRYAPRREALQRWTFFVVALLVLGAGLGLRDPWPPDEPRFALAARDMVETGEWFFPKVAGSLYPDKPPVGLWLMALGYALTGSLAVGFLLPSLAAGLGTLLLVYDLGRRLWHHRIGLAAAGALLVAFQFGLQARSAQLDALLTFFVTLGLYGLLRHALLGPAWGWYAFGGFMAGVGVVTKGVGVIALLALLPSAWARARDWRHLPRFTAPGYAWAAAPLATLAAVALWLVPMLALVAASGDPALAAYRDEILFKQTAGRYADPWHHIKPWWYYLVEVAPLFWLPLSALLPWAVPAWCRRLARRDARQLALLGFVALVLLFFSLTPGKRGVYILPALPALALAFAPFLPGLLAKRHVQRAGAALLLLAGLAAAALCAQLSWLSPKEGALLAARHGVELGPLLVALAIAAFGWLAWGRLARGMIAAAGFMATVWLVHGLAAYPLLDDARSARAFMRRLDAVLPADAALAMVGWEEQFILQARRPVVHFGFHRGGDRDETQDGLAWLLAAPDRRLLLSGASADASGCVDTSQAVALGHQSRRDWLLMGADAVLAPCRARLAMRRVTATHAPLP